MYLLIFGTRPEAIKMAPLALELKKNKISFKICVTGQHIELLETVLDFFEIKADYNLSLMKKNQNLNSLSSRILFEIDKILDKLNPTLVFVHGDTTTAYISALAAFNRNIKVAHVEAGLRTNNIRSPFPEEFNRKSISMMADINFSPTTLNKKNLIKEGINKNKIFVTGNTVIDALKIGKAKLDSGKFSDSNISYLKNMLSYKKRTILLTAHRRENFGKPLINIFEGIKKLVEIFDDIQIIYPVHLNPNVYDIAHKFFKNIKDVRLIPPVDYPSLIFLLKESYFVITDSGGIQEEAPSFGKPVLVIRNESERIEAVTSGTVKLIGTDKNKLIDQSEKLLNDNIYYNNFRNLNNPYGDGNSCKKIISILNNE